MGMTREEAYNRIDAIIAKYEIDDEYVTITNLKDYEALRMARKILEQESEAEKVIKMRDATPEEQKSVDDYIKSISKPTGVKFGALEREPVLDKIKGYIDHIRNTGMGKKKSLEFIEKFIEGLKPESENEE